jgi:HK97 family phage portal protein
MFERLQKWLRGKADPGGDPRTSSGWEILGGIPGWSNAGEIWAKKLDASVRNLEKLNGQQSAVWACVHRLCLAAQEAPPRIGAESPDGWTDLPDHPMQALLDAPNPKMSYPEFLNHYLMHLELTGDTRIWKWRNKAGYITELWPVPTSWVTLNAEKGVYEIWQGSNKPAIPALPQDLARIFHPDPSSLTLVLGPLQAALRDVRVDEARQDYQMELLANNKRPGLVLYQPEDWSAEQKEDVRTVFMQNLGDAGRGKTVFMQGEGAKVEPIPPVGELDWPGLTGLSETRICSCFGVPPIVIGLRAGLENATYSNYEQALRAFYEGTMVGLWQLLDAGLTRAFLTDEGETDGAEIYHDTEGVKGLKEDADKRATRAAQLFAGGLCTRNEGREMAGLDSLDAGGDVFVLPMNLVETPAAQLGQPQEQPPKDNLTTETQSTQSTA